MSQYISSGLLIPKLRDRSERSELRRQVRRALERSPRVEEPSVFRRGTWTMESYCDQLADIVGKPVRLMPVDSASLPRPPFSSMEVQGDSYVIYYREDASDIFYRDMLIFRQIARLLCGLPVPESAFPMDQWTGYNTPDQILLETVATNLVGKTDRARETPLLNSSIRELRAVARAVRGN